MWEFFQTKGKQKAGKTLFGYLRVKRQSLFSLPGGESLRSCLLLAGLFRRAAPSGMLRTARRLDDLEAAVQAVKYEFYQATGDTPATTDVTSTKSA